MTTKYYPTVYLDGLWSVNEGGWEDSTASIKGYALSEWLVGTSSQYTSQDVGNGTTDYDFFFQTWGGIPRITTATTWGTTASPTSWSVSADIFAAGSNLVYDYASFGGIYRLNNDMSAALSSSSDTPTVTGGWTGTGIKTDSGTDGTLGNGTAPTQNDRLGYFMRIQNTASMHSNENVVLLISDSDTWVQAPWTITDGRSSDYLLPDGQVASSNGQAWPIGLATHSVTDDDPAYPTSDFFHNNLNGAGFYTRLSFPTPSGSLDTTTNIQKLRALIYNGDSTTKGFRLALYEDSTIVGSATSANIPASQLAFLEHTFSVADLTTASGVDVQAHVSKDGSSDVSTNRGSARILAVDWYAPIAAGGSTQSASAALSAAITAAIAASPILAGSASLDVAVTLAAAASPTLAAAATLSAVGTLAAAGSRIKEVAATLDASATVAASALYTAGAAATLNATATLAATGSPVYAGAAALSAAGTLGIAAIATYAGAALLDASGDVAVSATLVKEVTAALTAQGTLTADGGVFKVGTASLSAIGSLAVAAAPIFGASAAMNADGTVNAAAMADLAGAASLTAAATFGVAASPILDARAALDASATIAATAKMTAGASISMSALATMAAAAAPIFGGSATLSASGTIGAAGQGTFAAATLINVVGTIAANATVSSGPGGSPTGPPPVGTLTLLGVGR